MTNSQLESNYSISNLTVAELEALITKIVQKVIREEIRNKEVEKETVQSQDKPNHLDYDRTPRPFGLWRGKVQMSDNFDVLPESIAAAFAGEEE